MRRFLLVLASVILLLNAQSQVKSDSRASYRSTTNVVAGTTTTTQKQVFALGVTALECVCSCGVDCSTGRIICTSDCGSCSEEDCLFCIGSCCVAAAKAEGCVQQ